MACEFGPSGIMNNMPTNSVTEHENDSESYDKQNVG